MLSKTPVEVIVQNIVGHKRWYNPTEEVKLISENEFTHWEQMANGRAFPGQMVEHFRRTDEKVVQISQEEFLIHEVSKKGFTE